MKAVILAAGEGTRLRPFTKNTPKPLVEIGDTTILEYTLNQLPDKITEAIIVIGYHGREIKDHFGTEFKGIQLDYVAQKKLKGTADALFSCQKKLKNEEKFLVVNGDDLYKKEDLEKLVEKNLAAMVKETEEPGKFGIARLNDGGKIKQIKEKPQDLDKGLANIGAYVLNPKIFSYEPVKITDKEYGLPQTLEKMAADYDVDIVKASFWVPIGYPEDIKKAEKKLNS